jgi:1,4-dihydroxy-2-naphthoate octaprenyltransferase
MLAYLGLLPCFVLIIHLNKVMQTKNPADFDPELKKVALSTFALTVFTSVFLNI